jgi:dTDP-4-dehydrorhamnose 3,5-epimerase
MKINLLSLQGPLALEPKVHQDDRGYFLEIYHEKRYRDAGIVEAFVQENHSHSLKNVLRGMHFQIKRPQAQIVTVLKGEIFDVLVDLRPFSKTYGKWTGVQLKEKGLSQLYMPAGFAHGYYTMSETADLHYKVSELYNPGDEGGLLWNDENIGINWPQGEKIISKRDLEYPSFKEINETRSKK